MSLSALRAASHHQRPPHTHIEGEIRKRDTYKADIRVNTPPNHTNITLVADDELRTPFVARRDYTWERLGAVLMMTAINRDFEAVLRAY